MLFCTLLFLFLKMAELGVARFTEITEIDLNEHGGIETDLVSNLRLSITEPTSATQFSCDFYNQPN